MFSVAGLQGLILLVMAVVVLGMQGYALVDAARQKPQVFVAAGKLTKQKWMIILGISLAFGLLGFPSSFLSLGVLGILYLAAVVAAGVYLVDVRPALRSVSGGGRSGPYGPW
jgi:hypothetical protein